LQLETLQSLRGRKRTARQSITVRKDLHQHVHYHRGEGQGEGQPHEPGAGAIGERPTLLSPEPGREVVSLPSRARKKRL
jgi:hypothetical protein